MKKILSLLLVTMLVLSLAACGASAPAAATPSAAAPTTAPQAATPAPAPASDKIVIGLSMPSLQSTFFEGEKTMAEKVAKDAGVEVISVIADGDATKQKSQIEDLISKKVDAIICVPQDTQAIVSSAADCKAAGIPFIAMGRMPADMTNVTLGIICDNFTAAKACAEAMAAAAKAEGYTSIKAIELVGDLKDQNAKERTDGFKQYAKENNIEIVAQVATEWDADKAFNRLTDTLQNVGEFNAMYIPSDFLLPSVMSALTAKDRWVAAGQKGHVIITSIDGDPTAMDMINNGFVYSTANTDAFDFGKFAMEGAIEIAKGKMPTEVKRPIPTVSLTKEAIAAAGDTIWGNVYKK